jgi:hypothetical protein
MKDTLKDLMLASRKFQFKKHGGTSPDQTEEEYVEQSVNWLTQYDFLTELSEALEHLQFRS